MFLKNVTALATFSPEKMTKSTLARGDHLFAGLNSFEPGQEHALHAHAGQDKLYVILQGSATVQIGEQTQHLTAGDAALAPSGIPHAIHNPGPERLIVMAILTPPPPNG
jgi:quercetin dioxygenase-like cupin family protein